MEWIKASERLPEDFKHLNIKNDGIPDVAYWDGDSHFICPDRSYHKENVEWLDESPNESTQAAQIDTSEVWTKQDHEDVSQEQAVKELWDALDKTIHLVEIDEFNWNRQAEIERIKVILEKHKPKV
jgi:hypothetical protein